MNNLNITIDMNRYFTSGRVLFRKLNKLHIVSALILCSLMISLQSSAQVIRVKTGIEILKDTDFKILQGKRVGLITNATGVDNNLKSTIDILHEAPQVKLVALYGPEHGVRGDVYAGDKISDFRDANTGIPVF